MVQDEHASVRSSLANWFRQSGSEHLSTGDALLPKVWQPSYRCKIKMPVCSRSSDLYLAHNQEVISSSYLLGDPVLLNVLASGRLVAIWLKAESGFVVALNNFKMGASNSSC